ncbi:Gfo/Idh/MocA family protein [Sphingobacterium sp. LRF_L2]|uniref:Gfo/Idh/MocA family protein n=1 Tax=Sphingobacterium sp. LRF_L2 TaxID=3369421 RepID=UPI003F5FFF55
MNRRSFFNIALPLGVLSLLSSNAHATILSENTKKRIGVIGLDSSHTVAFSKTLFEQRFNTSYLGYQITAIFPFYDTPIASNKERIPKFLSEVQNMNINIVSSVAALLEEVDHVMILTNDGNTRLQQVKQVLKSGKMLFIDKPIASSYTEAKQIFELAKKFGVAFFSSSSLRFQSDIQALDKSKVYGADVYTPCPLEPSHKDLYWYGIHGVEMLFSIMGGGCKEVYCSTSADADLITGKWNDGRYATLRAIKNGKQDFGGTVFLQDEIVTLKKFEGYTNLLNNIVNFFDSGKLPFDIHQTLEICAFMDAAHQSKNKTGQKIMLKY